MDDHKDRRNEGNGRDRLGPYLPLRRGHAGDLISRFLSEDIKLSLGHVAIRGTPNAARSSRPAFEHGFHQRLVVLADVESPVTIEAFPIEGEER